MPHTRLRGQMNNRRYVAVLTDKAMDRLPIGHVRCVKCEAWLAIQPRQPRLLQPHVVVGVQVVHAEHALAARQQRLGDMITDEARRSGQQDRHSGRATRRSSSNSRTA